jgi:hypothetical protein
MEEALPEKIDAALAEIRPMAAQSFEPAISIERELRWCRNFVLGCSQEDRPALPVSMSIAALTFFVSI